MSGRGELVSLIDDVIEQLEMIRPDADQLARDCLAIDRLLGPRPAVADLRRIKRLASRVAAADPTDGAPVLALFEKLLPRLSDPLKVLGPLVESPDPALVAAAVELLLGPVRRGVRPLDRPMLKVLARLAPAAGEAEAEGGAEGGGDWPPALAQAAEVLARDPGSRESLQRLLAGDRDPGIRLLAATLLDREGEPAPADLAENLLGREAHRILQPYLEFTRASHRDLLDLTPGRKPEPSVHRSVAAGEARFGRALLRQLISLIGWASLNRGIELRHRAEVVIPGYPPAHLPLDDAAFLTRAQGVRRGPERIVAVAVGEGPPAPVKGRNGGRSGDPVDRFRRLNTTHADLLAEILDVAPLIPAKVERILGAMDRIVADYSTLFAGVSEECAILPEVYGDLKGRVLAETEGWCEGMPLSPELTRLVQMFEDPGNLGQVRTVHGLKRYLHQKGLRYGFALVDAAQTPNRTVDLVLVDRRGRLTKAPAIRYAEFEKAAEIEGDAPLPFPVGLLVDAWERQLLDGRLRFPDVNVYLFGNEVHYYFFFRNHPVFLRVDYSPPQRGGMIDLEYYGVSNFELDVHPNLRLDAIRLMFRDLGCDVSLDGTRLQVRYDKERCPDLGDLCAKASALFRLAPWLMEVDWQIGSLAYGPESRGLVEAAWSDRFVRSGVILPRGLLTADRSRILKGYDPGPTGPVERSWNGREPYEDLYNGECPPGFLGWVRGELERLRLTAPAALPGGDSRGIGLNLLEEEYLGPWRRARRSGWLAAGTEAPEPPHPELVQLLHEAEAFAEILAGDEELAAGAVALARPMAELERFIEFQPTGTVGRLCVERGRLPVRGGWLTVFLLRDQHRLVRMGLACEGDRLFRRRSGPRSAWQSNVLIDPGRMWALLRGANYLAGSVRAPGGVPAGELDHLRDLASSPATDRGRPRLEEEKILGGVKAAPGRAVGRAVFGVRGRRPEDVAGAVLIAREIRPEDNPFLFHAAGVVSIGGAVLSHAALVAIQYGKPALLAPAQLERDHGRSVALHFTTTVRRRLDRVVHGFRVSVQGVVGKRADQLRDGDLVVLDADESVVRILGQDRDTLSLWEGLRLLGEAARSGDSESDAAATLAARAAHLRARHQVEKILDRLADKVLAAFALEEILAGADLAAVPETDRARLLGRLLANPAVAEEVSGRLRELVDRLEMCTRLAVAEALEGIPAAGQLGVVLGYRLKARRCLDASRTCAALLAACGQEVAVPGSDWTLSVDRAAQRRLQDMSAAGRQELDQLVSRRHPPARARHLVRHIERCGQVLGGTGSDSRRLADVGRRLERAAAAALKRHADALVLGSSQCGFPLHPLIGWKAANLGEMEALAGPGLCPAWFVVTDRAFGLALEQRVSGTVLEQAITRILEDGDLDFEQQSARIRALWMDCALPVVLEDAVTAAYRGLGPDGGGGAVAIRSSSRDEDTEVAMKAGEFETYLNVMGEGALLEHLRLTWAGLWSERALHNRATMGVADARPAGGLIVQRMVDARVSGVVQTVNIARGDLGEMVINAGLGLGEGVVSGQVAADLVTVVKAPRRKGEALAFNYVTNDKPLMVVRDERRGSGTRLVETLYHQRLRPALEYTELLELVEKVEALEAGYGYPLDLEFAIEGTQVMLLQARPIATFLAELNETLKRHPLDPRALDPQALDPQVLDPEPEPGATM
ncbi:MAG: PEP/pyruvate-binding domain-containing protein [bacterium]